MEKQFRRTVNQSSLANRDNRMIQASFQAQAQLQEEEYLHQSMISESGLNAVNREKLFYGKAFIVKPIFGY